MSDTSLDHKSILIIFPRKDWDLNAFWIYKICLELLDLKSEITLVCRKDSYLYEQLKDFPIHFIFQYGQISFKFWHWKELDPVFESITQRKIDLIHSFDIRYIWPLFFYLRKYPHIPLLHFQGAHISERYNRIWHKILKRRVDHLFVPHKRNLDYIHLQFNFPYRKMSVVGVPKAPMVALEKDFIHHLDWDLVLEGDKLKKENHLIGIEVTPYTKKHQFESLFQIILSLKKSGELKKKKLKIFLGSKRRWSNNPLYGPLSRMALENDFKNEVSFYPSENLRPLIQEMDLWVVQERKSYINESILTAIDHNTPVLGPKSEQFSSWQQLWPDLMRSYLPKDGRSIYYGMRDLLQSSPQISDLEVPCSANLSLIMSQYIKSLQRRKRVLSRRHLSHLSG